MRQVEEYMPPCALVQKAIIIQEGNHKDPKTPAVRKLKS